MNYSESYKANGSTVYFSKAADLEKPFDQIAADLNTEVVDKLPSLPYVISGSAVLRLFIRYVKGEDPSFEETDVDIYAESPSDYEKLVQEFTKHQNPVYRSHSARNITFNFRDYDFDFVCHRYGGLLEIISTHDLSACGIGVAVDDGLVQVFGVTKEFVRTMNDGKLRLQNGFSDSDPLSMARTIDRVFKYKSRGYHPTFQLLDEIAKHIYSKKPKELEGINTVAEQVAEASKTENTSE